MRMSINDQRRISVLIAVLLTMIILLPDGSLMADAPGFSIDNSFERDQEYIPGGWNIVDTYNQVYTLDWQETYSSRLAVQMTFQLEMEDIIRSFDVDEKQLTPSFELDLSSLIWNLNFLVQDTIDLSNEFNMPRKDALEFGLDLGLSPLYLPPLKVQLQRLIDTQENLEDKVESKFDVSTDYAFADFFDVDMSWKEEDTDDRLFDDNDVSSHEWDFNFNYGQVMTPAFKVDFQAGMSGGKEETRNNAGTLLLVEREKGLDAALKFTLDTFPDFTSDLEITRDRDFVADSDEDQITLSAEYTQPLVDLGTLTENLELGRKTVSSPTEETLENDFEFTIELAGAPYKYTDYSIKYNYSIGDLEDEVAPANNKKTVAQEFDLSLTFEPNEKVTLDTSYNWSSSKENGVGSGSDSTFKLEGVFDGELLNIPNLTFTPSLEIATEKNFTDGADSNSYSMDLDFVYTLVLPRNISWELQTIYNWKQDDGEITRDMDLDSELDIDFITPTWDFNFGHSASTAISFDGTEPTFWDHDFTFGASRELTPRIFFDVEYQYQYSGDGENSDDFETNLEWRGRDSSLAFKVTNERVFEGPKDVQRTYAAEFTMDF